MANALNKFIILLFAFLLQLHEPFTIHSVLPFLIGIACSLAMDIVKIKARYLPIILFLGLCFIVPDTACYIPLMIYDGYEKDKQQNSYYLLLLFGVVLLCLYQQAFGLILMTILASIAAMILKHKFQVNQILFETYKKQRDTTKEFTNLMEERNHDLLMKQDYEIRLATLNERNRIAREIHDNVGHLLSSSLLQIGALKAINTQTNICEPLQSVQETLNNAMNSIRHSVHDLHHDAFDLDMEVQKILQSFTFCKTYYTYDVEHPFDKEVVYHILSILKEALNNIMKHSNATKVEIIIREQPHMYQVIIHDNGTSKSSAPAGIGLRNMKQRIDQLHGYFHIANDHGFRIFITLSKEVSTCT